MKNACRRTISLYFSYISKRITEYYHELYNYSTNLDYIVINSQITEKVDELPILKSLFEGAIS